MTIAEWQSLDSATAAREVHRRAGLLSPSQHRAVVAGLVDEPALARALGGAGRAAPLAGVPYFLKDLFPIAGWPTGAGSTFLPEVLPAPTADGAIVRALRAAGAACAGKTHLHEFAYGITGENSHYGDCEHPHFPGRTTGGSSSGSAAAVAAGIVPLAVGSDTGGSVRLPAAFCGLFGFRLTPGDPFIADAFPLSPTCDTAGWFTAGAGDMRTVIRALCGSSPAASKPVGCYLEMPGLEAEVAAACRCASERLVPARDEMRLDALATAFAGTREIYNTIVAAEAWQVHRNWADLYRERYDPAVWQRLNRARELLPLEVNRARERQVEIKEIWRAYFATHDFLVLPAAPFGALTKAECTLENRGRILALTAPASLGGLPVLTVPVRLPSGLTSGLQVVVSHPQSPVIDWALAQFSGRG